MEGLLCGYNNAAVADSSRQHSGAKTIGGWIFFANRDP